MEALLRYGYPGHIGEPENIVNRAVVPARATLVTTPDLPAHVLGLVSETDVRTGSFVERVSQMPPAAPEGTSHDTTSGFSPKTCVPPPARAPAWHTVARLTVSRNSRQMLQMPERDAATVARARDGDSEAFRVLVERHSRSVYNVAYRLTGNQADAEDVVQETFLKAYRQLDRVEDRSSFGTWLHRIAWNCSVDLLRSRPKREQAEEVDTLEQLGSTHGPVTGEAGVSPERLMASVQVGDRVRAAMTRLSPLERAAFVMRHYEGRSIDEISRALNIRENAAKHSIFRAVRKMRLALEPFVT